MQLINTWRQAGLSRGFVDYSENGGHHQAQPGTRHPAHRSEYRVRPGLKKAMNNEKKMLKDINQNDPVQEDVEIIDNCK